ncbi:hypothetical protein HDU76_013049 [Blyttiomyces sp. JEL0837]|nr:hypothetical protein HDU76_013049 [Blyttiomyces sp. JEL0837]
MSKGRKNNKKRYTAGSAKPSTSSSTPQPESIEVVSPVMPPTEYVDPNTVDPNASETIQQLESSSSAASVESIQDTMDKPTEESIQETSTLTTASITTSTVAVEDLLQLDNNVAPPEPSDEDEMGHFQDSPSTSSEPAITATTTTTTTITTSTTSASESQQPLRRMSIKASTLKVSTDNTPPAPAPIVSEEEPVEPVSTINSSTTTTIPVQSLNEQPIPPFANFDSPSLNSAGVTPIPEGFPMPFSPSLRRPVSEAEKGTKENLMHQDEETVTVGKTELAVSEASFPASFEADVADRASTETDESGRGYVSSDTSGSSDLGIIARKTPRATAAAPPAAKPIPTVVDGPSPKTAPFSSSAAAEATSRNYVEGGKEPPKKGFWGSLVKGFQNFIDPELTPEQLGVDGDDVPPALAPAATPVHVPAAPKNDKIMSMSSSSYSSASSQGLQDAPPSVTSKPSTSTLSAPFSDGDAKASTSSPVMSPRVIPEVEEQPRYLMGFLPHTPPQADADFQIGKTLLALLKTQNKKQQMETYILAQKKLEAAAIAGPHPEAMKLLAEQIYCPASPLCNAFKAAYWTKQRVALMETPLGMMAQATYLFRSAISSLEKDGVTTTAMIPVSPLTNVTMAKFVPTLYRKSPKDGECIVLVRTAADMNHAPAMYEFGVYLRESGKGAEAMVWFHRAAEAGFAEAERRLAEGYETGLYGVPRDDVAGAAWRARVAARDKVEEEELLKRQVEEAEIAERVRAEAAERAEKRRLMEEEAKMRELQAAARLSMDPALRGAIRNIQWGYYNSGIEQLQRLATAGHVDAQNYLNPLVSPLLTNSKPLPIAMYHLGQHHAGLADPVLAVGWFRNASEAGYHEAMVTYAAYLIAGKGLERSDPGQAMAWLIKAWDTGKNKEAALALGEAFTKGIGVFPDPVKAVKWYTRAWEQGRYPEAAFSVGLACATGFTPGAVDPSQWSQSMTAGSGSDPNVNETLKARTEQKKEKGGSEEDKTGQGATSPQTPSSPSTTPNGSASNSTPTTPSTASTSVSTTPSRHAHQLGLKVPQRLLDEHDDLSRTVTRSISSPELNAGLRPGSNMPTSRPASPTGSVTSLGSMDQGSGAASANGAGSLSSSPSVGIPMISQRRVLKGLTAVKQDLPQAAAWYRKASDFGHARACNNLGELYMTGRGVPRDDSVGFALFKRASSVGLPEAEYNVGRCYREGRGCPRNEEMAILWFKKAEAKGISEATRAIAASPLMAMYHYYAQEEAQKQEQENYEGEGESENCGESVESSNESTHQ